MHQIESSAHRKLHKCKPRRKLHTSRNKRLLCRDKIPRFPRLILVSVLLCSRPSLHSPGRLFVKAFESEMVFVQLCSAGCILPLTFFVESKARWRSATEELVIELGSDRSKNSAVLQREGDSRRSPLSTSREKRVLISYAYVND